MENETTIIDAEHEILDDGDTNTCTVIDDTLCYDNIVLVPNVKYYLYETRYLLLLPFFTSSTFMIPFIWVLYTHHYLPVPTFIMCVVLFETIVSLLFWYDPINNQATNIHKIDGIFARISICTMHWIFGSSDELSRRLKARLCLFAMRMTLLWRFNIGMRQRPFTNSWLPD